MTGASGLFTGKQRAQRSHDVKNRSLRIQCAGVWPCTGNSAEFPGPVKFRARFCQLSNCRFYKTRGVSSLVSPSSNQGAGCGPQKGQTLIFGPANSSGREPDLRNT